jgi:hypothetical protein
MILFRMLHSLLNSEFWMLTGLWLLTLYSISWGRLPAARRENTFSKGLSISQSNLFLSVTGGTVHRCLRSSRFPGRYRGNALLNGTCPVLGSRYAATDLLVAKETRLAVALPRDSRTNFPAFRQHVTIFYLLWYVCMYIYIYICIVTCRVVLVTIMTSSSSDDWIYWHFGYNLS